MSEDDIGGTMGAAEDVTPDINAVRLAIKRLAAMDRLEYETVRDTEAKALGVRVSVLDNAVTAERATKRGSGKENDEDAPRPDPWPLCQSIAHSDDVLDLFIRGLRAAGVVGEDRACKLIYLCLCSRLLDRIVSLAAKGASSSGKSYITEQVLRFFPAAAYYAVTSFSEHALAYSEESLEHRFIVIFEATGMEGEFQTYLMRSLLSEGCIRYETVEKVDGQLTARLIERKGPTGLLVTTTASAMHPENETRLVSLAMTDTREHTHDVLLSLADETHRQSDMTPWHAFQRWLAESGCREVTIPYAISLARLVPPVAVRLRRDFAAILSLIRTHAMLHQVSREKTEDGRIVATLDDYAQVRALVVDLVSESAEQTVPPIVRETVQAVAELIDGGKDEVSQADLRKRLNLDRSAVSGRVNKALYRGFLKNLEKTKGKAHRLVIGDPVPEEAEILPTVLDLTGDRSTDQNTLNGADFCGFPADRSTVLRDTEGVTRDTYNDAEPEGAGNPNQGQSDEDREIITP